MNEDRNNKWTNLARTKTTPNLCKCKLYLVSSKTAHLRFFFQLFFYTKRTYPYKIWGTFKNLSFHIWSLEFEDNKVVCAESEWSMLSCVWWEWKCGWCGHVHSGIMAASEQVDHHKTKQPKWYQSKENKIKKSISHKALIHVVSKGLN